MGKELYKDWFKSLRNEPISASASEGSTPFLKLISPEKKTVLVIGCGDGHEVAWLNHHGFEAVGITASNQEAIIGKKKYNAKIFVRDMHNLGKLGKFDCVFAGNVLEHSPMPYLALLHWRKYLKNDGWLVLVMPSKEWLLEHYHLSVMTRSQTKDLLNKAGFELLAGPQTKSKIDYHGGEIFYDLGRKWGFLDGYVSRLTVIPKNEFLLENAVNINKKSKNLIVKIVKLSLKYPYNFVRRWHSKNIREW